MKRPAGGQTTTRHRQYLAPPGGRRFRLFSPPPIVTTTFLPSSTHTAPPRHCSTPQTYENTSLNLPNMPPLPLAPPELPRAFSRPQFEGGPSVSRLVAWAAGVAPGAVGRLPSSFAFGSCNPAATAAPVDPETTRRDIERERIMGEGEQGPA